MLISDISYIETVSEENIEGSGSATFFGSKSLAILAQAVALGESFESLSLVAETGVKAIGYSSTTVATGLV
jgi:hypothetical protein